MGNTSAYAEFEEGYDASKDKVFAQEMQAILKLWKNAELGSKSSRCTGSGSYFAGLYHRKLLHLHQGNLAGLGLMYVEDERFSANIDRAGG